MKLSLSDFEHQVMPKILERGLSYYKKGSVFPESISRSGESSFIVNGSEPYDVTIRLDGDEVVDYSCSCPYDMGPVCKHVVAALFFMTRDDMMELYDDVIADEEKISKSEPAKVKAFGKKRVARKDLDRILNSMSVDDLREFIKKECEVDDRLRQRLFSIGADKIYAPTPELYLSQIEGLLRTYGGKYGYVEYSQARHLGSGLSEIVDAAREAVCAGKWEQALARLQAVAGSAEDVINACDDSGGYVGGAIYGCFEAMEGISEDRSLPDDVRTRLFDYAIGQFRNRVLHGWDHYWTWITIATNLADTADRQKTVMGVLDEIKSTGKFWDYDYDCARRLKLAMIERYGTEEEAERYMQDNVDDADIRATLISRAFDRADYDEVLRLADDGIKNDDKNKPGLADDWKNWKLKAYMAVNDTANIASLARYFLLGRGERYNTRKYYYDLLRASTPLRQWKSVIGSVVAEIKGNGGRWVDVDFLCQIYVWEEEWSDYFSLLAQNADLRSIEKAEPYLANRFGQGFIMLYADALRSFVRVNIGREHYREACRYLRRIKKLGAKDAATALIAEFRSEYPKRRALMAELDNV